MKCHHSTNTHPGANITNQQRITSSIGNIFRVTLCEEIPSVTGEFPSQRPVTQSFDVFFDLRLNKRLSKKSTHRWFETPLCPLWRHCNESGIFHAALLPVHYNDVMMGGIASQITSHTIVYSFIQTQIKENIKAPRHWPLCGEFNGDRWIPITNGQ